MPENTTDDEPTDENANQERSVIDEIRHRQADDEEESEGSEGSGSKLRTLLFLGFAFIAGYLVGKSRSESDFEELGEFSGAEGGPMEIEIHDTESATKSDEDDEAEDADEAAETDETERDESADEAEGDENEGGDEEEEEEE
ncbi:hypothetical protein [Haladaptatus sp. R4]|uniref:hypothetical protein n=1 Tax=Haladaptatus sp. R4 TaxID=1679489 RepID=UPI000ADE7171|nr:hypothetical protein [Haladaptatus sp. R4]